MMKNEEFFLAKYKFIILDDAKNWPKNVLLMLSAEANFSTHGVDFNNILWATFALIFVRKKVKKTSNVSTKKLHAKLLYRKAVRKLLVKLTKSYLLLQSE
jgi:hypothetical protein